MNRLRKNFAVPLTSSRLVLEELATSLPSLRRRQGMNHWDIALMARFLASTDLVDSIRVERLLRRRRTD